MCGCASAVQRTVSGAMSHNPWALLGDEGDGDAGGSGDEAMRDGAPSAPPPPPPQALRSSTPEPPAAGAALSRKQQRQMSKRAQRIAKATASVAASAPSASSADAVDVASDSEDDDDDEDEEEGADDAPMAGAGATAPAEVGLSAAELATTTRVLGLLQTHHGLLEHAALKAVRSSLAPLVERLAAQWKLGRVQSATQRLKALKRSHKNMLSSDSVAAREYAAALDSAARNATGMRAQRLSKLEALNTLKDGEAEDEEVVARRALLASMRVPDGVAITDGSSQDVCMKLLTDESAGKANGGGKRQKLLTGASSGGPAVVDGAAPAAAASTAASPTATGPLPSATLHTPIKCYTCKTPFRELHHFYDSLCPTCAKLNFSKRSLSADLSGKIVLVTGARVKIGYRILVKLLRCGAFVVATTRFPHDLSKRLLLEHDHSAWSARVHVVGIDFRNLQVLEDFVKLMYAKYSHLDAIINNACQTVRRPPAFYQHLIDAERVAYDDLKPEAQNMLRLHHGFALGHSSGLLQAGGGDMRRLQSGSGVDIDLPSMDGASSSSNGAASTSQHSQQPKAASSVQFTRSAPSGITIEEYAGEDDDAAAEEIVAGISGGAGKRVELPPSPRNPTASSGSPASSAAASAAAAASSTAAASASASKQPGNQAPKGKKSRRAAMREAATAPPAAAASSTSQALSLGADAFVSPTALAAESTQLAVLASDNMSAEERARLFPSGARDINGQQVDLRAKNSWTMRLADVPIGEAAEVMAINYLAPMLLNSQLKALMIRGNEDKKQARFIINVSAMEGKFYRYKSANHPHTNAAKAALNMMTRTSAQDYVDANIFMTAVDTGWINDENPLPTAAKIASQHNFQTPLDEVDAAMRVLDPMLAPLAALQANPALSVKEAKIPYGVFLKDYAKCEW